MSKDVYTDYYLFFGDDEKDFVDTRTAAIEYGRLHPLVILKRGENKITRVNSKRLPMALRQAMQLPSERYEIVRPPIRIQSGDAIYDLNGNQYIFDYDRVNHHTNITKLDADMEKAKPTFRTGESQGRGMIRNMNKITGIAVKRFK